MSPQVSVLMPVLNADPVFFPLALESVVAQTYTNWELVIVEDPGERRIADLDVDLSDSRIRHIENTSRTSLLEQRNQSLSLAEGEFVALLDADDIAYSDRLERQVGFLTSNSDIDVVGSRVDLIDSEGVSLGIRDYPLRHDEILRALPLYNPIAFPSAFFRRSRIVEAGGHICGEKSELELVDDYGLWSRLAKDGARFSNLAEPVIKYRIHTDASKATKLKESIRGTLAVKRKYWRKQLGVVGRIRMVAERLLMLLPKAVVLKLFLRMYCRKR